MITGLTKNSKKHFQLDAGAIFKNYDPATDTPATASAKLIGATVGGATFSCVPEVRQVSVDGAKGPTKGLEVIESYTGTLTANVKEVTVDSISMALAAVTAAASQAPSGYTKIVPKGELEDADYFDNVTWIGKMSGSNNPIMIVLKNAVNLNGFTLAAQDKNEANVPIVLTAHYDMDALDIVPIEIYVPDVA